MTARPQEPEPPEFQEEISADADDWIRQFIKHLELHLLDASRDLPTDASVADSTAGRKVSPMQLAAQILEDALANISEP